MNKILEPRPGRRLAWQLLAWCVHLYTALGLVAAAAIAVLIVRGDAQAFRDAFVLMLAATLVDATDGMLARRVKVKLALPNFSGRRLDDLIDFLTYTCLPLLLIWRAQLLPEGTAPWLLLPLLASAYGFCQENAKTVDGYFLGFPSYWNLLAFYLFALQPLPDWLALTMIVLPALLTFVPSRYLYPSVGGSLGRLTWLLSAAWLPLLAAVLWYLPTDGERAWWLALASLYFPAYYLLASWGISVGLWRAKK